jgi:zinc protease
MIDLNKFLTGKVVKVNPGIGVLTQALNGSSGKKDLETMFQLTYLYFTQARKDTEAFNAFKSKLLNQVKFLMSNPQYVFYDTLIKLATSNDPRSIIIPTEDQINSLDLDQALAFYKDRYADAEGFRFFFVGNFDIDSITPLIKTYLGSLPAINRKDEWKDVEPKFPDGITKAVVHKGTEPKSSVAIMMKDDFEWEYANRLKMNLLMKILEIRLRESMREDQGGVYGVGVNHDLSKYPTPGYSITINWGCGPENVDTLVETVFNEMVALENDPPKDEDLQKAKETSIRDLETNVKKNNYWLSILKNAYYYNEEIRDINEKKSKIESITKEDIHQAAKQYFKNNHYLKVVLMPEESKKE